ncbi:type VI secretion system contractile sheath large subunit [Candidatus Manganitrophus noduliformans]|uniref:Type VI secretion system contractile sheath large subunit n=1 Tax=Candidatus Manganitrophus noduliformans TaxID=2606439 RepID=A0A7X6DSG2_9BACT|nr:type VI secretion system contractile sheath large subunit [Candidatus Manganitrophus noduliformans]NKE72412.1 type VI secretion system contractile sheath large subunit [Candidatus Manganitrophus noduliformans]
MEIHMKMGSDGKRKTDVRVADQAGSLRQRFPLKLLVLAELAPRDEQSAPSTIDARRTRVDKETFGAVLQSFVGRVSLTVPNRLGSGPKEWPITLPIGSIKSFHPDAVVEAVPALRDLLEIRQQLVRLRNREISYENFRTELGRLQGGGNLLGRIQSALEAGPAQSSTQRTAPPPAPVRSSTPSGEKESALDSLFDMVEAPVADRSAPESATASTSRLDRFISEVISSGRPGTPADPRAVDAVMKELDEMLGAQLDAILHHPEFQRLEAVWRGVKFLVDRTDFREPIEIDLLHAPKEQLAEIFDRDVFQPESEGTAEAPVSVIIADYIFDRSPRDIELLQDLAEKAEQLQTPLVTAVGPAFLGLESIEELEPLDAAGNLFDQTEYVKWRSLRQGNASRWLAVLFNRFLLRLPYGPEQNRVKRFDFRESVRSDRSFLWGNPAWGLASLLTASFAKTGWCSEVTGARGGGMIEDLPLREVSRRNGEKGQLPLEAPISEAHRIDLAANGILALTCRLNADAVVIPSVPSAHQPERYPDPRETALSAARAAFPYQLVAGRLSQAIGRAAGEIGEGNSPSAIGKIFTKILTEALSVDPDAIEVQAKESEERPDRYDVFITFRPDHAGLSLSAPVGLSLSLRK